MKGWEGYWIWEPQGLAGPRSADLLRRPRASFGVCGPKWVMLQEALGGQQGRGVRWGGQVLPRDRRKNRVVAVKS